MTTSSASAAAAPAASPGGGGGRSGGRVAPAAATAEIPANGLTPVGASSARVMAADGAAAAAAKRDTDYSTFDRGNLMQRVLMHQLRIVRAAAAMAALAMPVLVAQAVTYNALWGAYVDAGGDPRRAALARDVNLAVAVHERVGNVVLSCAIALFTFGFIRSWTRLLSVCMPAAPPERPWSGPAAAAGVLSLWASQVWFLLAPYRGGVLIFVLAVLLLGPHVTGAFWRTGLVVATACSLTMGTLGYVVMPLAMAGTDMDRVFLRLVVIPLITEVWLAVTRRIVARIEPLASELRFVGDLFVSIATLPLLSMSLVGRVLATAVDGREAVVMLAGIAVVETGLRCTVRLRDGLYAALLGEGGALDGPAAVRVRLEQRAFEELSEAASILIVGAITLLFRLSWNGNAAPSAASVLLSVAVQLVLELGTDVLPSLFAHVFAPSGGLPTKAVQRLAVRTHIRWSSISHMFNNRFRRRHLRRSVITAGLTAVLLLSPFVLYPGELLCGTRRDGFWFNFEPCEA